MPASFLASQNAEAQTPEEVTPDNPLPPGQLATQQAAAEAAENEALKEIRLKYKQSWSIKRQALIRRVLKSFAYLKNNPYGVMNYGTTEMDNIAQVVAGNLKADDPECYQYNDNVFQMLCLSFMAALGPDVSKTRWMPDDPQDEDDLAFAKQASTMESFVERMNDMPSLQMLKLLYLWTAGTYFVYTRNLVDANRAGVTRQPVYAMQPQQVFPDRYLCPQCSTANPTQQYNPFVAPRCSGCGATLGQKDFYPAVSMSMPVQVDEVEQPNGFTGLDIFCLLNVDANPDAQDLAQSPILDLEGEMEVAAVRASYPEFYTQIAAGQFADETVTSTLDRRARELVTSPTASQAMTAEERRGSFSRCWIQPWAFDSLEDQAMSQQLRTKYPKGVKLVTYGADLVLEKRPENMLEHWTECRTIKGLGLFPFGVGDVALSVQDRIDDTANNIHIYMERMALPPVLVNAALVDANALGKVRWGGGRAIPVYPSLKTPGMRFSLQEAVWQPTFHADNQIYAYSQTLVMLMQLLTGVQPQIFGAGTQSGVDTASGQAQMLNTAMGRLMLFLTAMRSEGARTAKLSVKCMAADIDGQKRITVPSDVEGEYENAYILESQVQGEVHAFPDADQGFPAGYGEMRDRLIQILGMVEQNPVLQNMLSDPDMQKLLALYLLPDGAKLPGDAARTKIKAIVAQLAKGQPTTVPDPATGNLIVMPSIRPDPVIDGPALAECAQLAIDFANKNYMLATTNPRGYANVRAFIVLATSMQQQQQAKAAALQAAAGQPGGPGAAGGAGAPQAQAA